ncbi:ATP-binding cassette domain-containing protein [Flavobacteriaceae bacterium Ap0902]|nr:ATP-binding cassette domain-containing protein [Flavobacteriaceae bacterium Ap0902]
MIEVKNLRKSFGEIEVLKGITTSFEKGKTSLVIGSSGAGKTVFFKCLLGIYEFTAGDIIYDGHKASNDTKESKKERRTNIGTVFQYSALFDFMTVEDNVKFPLDMFSNMSNSEKEDRAHEVLKRVNLEENSFKRLPSEISGGMKKRVAIARAIVNQPKYLFCDEPNSGLDPKTANIIDNLIQEITKEYDITTIVNSHDMNSVLEIGEKIVFLNKGLLAWEGTNQEILHTEQEDVKNFVYNSNLMKKVRQALIKEGK